MKVSWLACWVENIQGSYKYVMLNPTSRLKVRFAGRYLLTILPGFCSRPPFPFIHLGVDKKFEIKVSFLTPAIHWSKPVLDFESIALAISHLLHTYMHALLLVSYLNCYMYVVVIFCINYTFMCNFLFDNTNSAFYNVSAVFFPDGCCMGWNCDHVTRDK